MTQDYIRIRIDRLPSQAEDEVTQLAFAHSASGVVEDLAFKQHNLALDPDVLPTKQKTLLVYFESQPLSQFFEAVRELAPNALVTSENEPHRDWLAEWKKGFHAFRLVDEFWLVPSWEESPVQSSRTIRIDPGMAFGTGTHATTQMMSHLVCRTIQNHNFQSMLDVGCGTGILSILADRLLNEKTMKSPAISGSPRCIGLEIDPIARDVARRNALDNATKSFEVLELGIEECEGPFDLIAANIIDGVLLKMKSDFLRLMHADSVLLLSGILADRDDQFIESFLTDTQLQVRNRLEHSDWVSYQLGF